MMKATAKLPGTHISTGLSSARIDLVCRTSSLSGLRAAVSNGADWIGIEYGGAHLRNRSVETSLANSAINKAIRLAHDENCKIALCIAATSDPATWAGLRMVIDHAVSSGIDAIELSDHALMLYCAIHYPRLSIHYAAPVMPSPDAINLLKAQFGIRRIALPRILSLEQVKQLAHGTAVELEVYGFGNDCALIDGRRTATINLHYQSTGPAAENKCTTDRHAVLYRSDEAPCAGIEDAANDSAYHSGHSLPSGALGLLPSLVAMGLRAIRIDTCHASATETGTITKIWREALHCCHDRTDQYSIKPSWLRDLDRLGKYTASH